MGEMLRGPVCVFRAAVVRLVSWWRAEAGSGWRRWRMVGAQAAKRFVFAVLVLELLWQQASKEQARWGGGGASAVEAGQSCSRHQGRHFLCREREMERMITL